MSDIEACPFCNTSAHKVVHFSNDVYYCKECVKFFQINTTEPRCPKCNSKRVRHSEYPMPNGEAVFHCDVCKKNFSAKDFFEKNNL